MRHAEEGRKSLEKPGRRSRIPWPGAKRLETIAPDPSAGCLERLPGDEIGIYRS